MGAILTIARAQVSVSERDQAKALFRAAFLEGEIGQIADSITLWESMERLGDYIAIMRYPDEAAADKGVEASSQTEALADIIVLAETPPDIRRYRITRDKGLREDQVDIGGVLSMSVRQADPGLGWDLDAELGRILDEIALLPGFLGSIHGRSATVHEQVMGIAFWRDKDSFLASVPSHHMYDLGSFHRVA
jgi:hypothetical protein